MRLADVRLSLRGHKVGEVQQAEEEDHDTRYCEPAPHGPEGDDEGDERAHRAHGRNRDGLRWSVGLDAARESQYMGWWPWALVMIGDIPAASSPPSHLGTS